MAQLVGRAAGRTGRHGGRGDQHGRRRVGQRLGAERLIERDHDVERRELSINPTDETAELAAMYDADEVARQARRAAADVMRRPEEALGGACPRRARRRSGQPRFAWRAAASSLVCFLFGALLPVMPWLSRRPAGARVGVRRDRRGRRRRRRCVIGRFADRPSPLVLRQVLIVLGACAITYATAS